MFAPARPPRQSLAFGSLGVTSTAEPPVLVAWWSAPLQPLRQAGWHIGRDASLPKCAVQRVRQSSHRAPPTAPPSNGEGDINGRLPTAAAPALHFVSLRGVRRGPLPFIPRCPCTCAAPRRSRSRTATDECGAEHSSTPHPTPRDQQPQTAPSEIRAGGFEINCRSTECECGRVGAARQPMA